MKSLAFAVVLAAVSSAKADDYHVMKKVQIVDRYGFAKPMTAGTMLVPKEWSFASNVIWGKSGCGDMVKVALSTASPDGKTAVEAFPSYGWQWADAPQSRQMMAQQNQQATRFNRPPCDVMQTLSAVDFITKVVLPKARPSAKVLDSGHMPDAHDAVQKQAAQAQAQAQQYGLKTRIAADDGRVRIAYDLQGSPVEEWLTAIVHMNAFAVPVFSGATYVQAATYSLNAQMLFALRAPPGQLEATKKLYELIIGSIRADPQWAAQVGQVQSNIAATRAKGEADRARIRAQTAEDVRKTQHDMYQHQQNAPDRSAQGFDQYIRGVESYRDPHSGEQVELPLLYGHAWSNGNGEYIVSDSANFDPNSHLNGNWRQLEHIR